MSNDDEEGILLALLLFLLGSIPKIIGAIPPKKDKDEPTEPDEPGEPQHRGLAEPLVEGSDGLACLLQQGPGFLRLVAVDVLDRCRGSTRDLPRHGKRVLSGRVDLVQVLAGLGGDLLKLGVIHL